VSAPSHYDALEIAPGASATEIRAAFDRLSSVFDAGSLAVYALIGTQEGEGELRRIREAFRVLGDPAARAAYDAAHGFPGVAPVEVEAPAPEARPAENVEPDGVIELTDADIISSVPLEAAQAPPESPPEDSEPVIDAMPAEAEPAAESPAPVDEEATLPADAKPAAALRIGEDTEFTGALLRALREARGLSLKDIAGRTRIGTPHLQNIEDEAFDRLPERVFLRGFLLSYARELKLDAARVADSYLRRRQP